MASYGEVKSNQQMQQQQQGENERAAAQQQMLLDQQRAQMIGLGRQQGAGYAQGMPMGRTPMAGPQVGLGGRPAMDPITIKQRLMEGTIQPEDLLPEEVAALHKQDEMDYIEDQKRQGYQVQLKVMV